MAIFYSKDGSVRATIEGSGNNGKTLYAVYYKHNNGMWDYEHYEEHKVTLYEWAKHLHGNAPAGTPYGYFKASKNGKRIIITV